MIWQIEGSINKTYVPDEERVLIPLEAVDCLCRIIAAVFAAS